MNGRAKQSASRAADILDQVERNKRLDVEAQWPSEYVAEAIGRAQTHALLAIYWQKEEEKDPHA